MCSWFWWRLTVLLQLIVIRLIVIRSTALFIILLLLLLTRLLHTVQLSYIWQEIQSTIGQELTYAADASFSLTRWQQFSAWNNIMPPCWNYDVKSVKWRTLTLCQISSQSGLKWQSLRLLWRGHPNKKNENEMNSDMRSVPNVKSRLLLDRWWPTTLNSFNTFSHSLFHYRWYHFRSLGQEQISYR